MLTRALQYNNYLTIHTQIRKTNYIVHFVTINNEEEKKIKTLIYSHLNVSFTNASLGGRLDMIHKKISSIPTEHSQNIGRRHVKVIVQ